MRYAASLPLFIGTGQLPDIRMRERQEVRDKVEGGMRHETELKGRGRKKNEQMRSEERRN